jgi:hypothetical protein
VTLPACPLRRGHCRRPAVFGWSRPRRVLCVLGRWCEVAKRRAERLLAGFCCGRLSACRSERPGWFHSLSLSPPLTLLFCPPLTPTPGTAKSGRPFSMAGKLGLLRAASFWGNFGANCVFLSLYTSYRDADCSETFVLMPSIDYTHGQWDTQSRDCRKAIFAVGLRSFSILFLLTEIVPAPSPAWHQYKSSHSIKWQFHLPS